VDSVVLLNRTWIARREAGTVSGKRAHRGFGYVRKLPSGRYQASYIGPDLLRHNALDTFQTKGDAEGWLGGEQALLSAGTWASPSDRTAATHRALTFHQYADKWMARRDLKPRTREHYVSLLEHQILPSFGEMHLKGVTSEAVRDWYTDMDPSRPTLRSHAYGLLRTILGTAVTDERIAANPCHIRGAGTTRRVKKIRPASLDELATITAAMPQRYQLMTLLAAWCALRFGESIELRRKDVDVKNMLLHVRRGAVRADGEVIIGTPKSEAGVRDVAIPPHLMPLVKEHLSGDITGGREGLLFPAADGTSTLAPSTLYRHFYAARRAAGRPDLRWHDLRHTGAVLAAATGATLAELMGRLGHSTPGAALRYQHAAQGRDAEIAAALSRLVAGES